MGRLACDVAGALPGSRVTGTLALVGATGVVVGVGVGVAVDGTGQDEANRAASASESQADLDLSQHGDVSGSAAQRSGAAGSSGSSSTGGADEISRGSNRPPLVSVQRATKSEAMPVAKQSMAGGVTETVAPASPQDIAMGMLADYGWSTSEFGCLDEIYLHESGWNPSAENPSSGAYGIPQALPGDKMATYGADWQTNPTTQLEWGLSYIRDSYGSPCGAWSFWQSNSWY